MASPIFYLVGLLVGAIVDWNREKQPTTLSCLLLVLLPMSIEGSSPRLSFNREETVQASQLIAASEEDVQVALSQSLRTDMPLPIYLRMGFPRPTEARGNGLEVGATRTIHFAGGEGHPGDLLLKVMESRPGYVRFEAVSDSSKVAHWLDWKSSEVDWRVVDAQHTRVTWTLHFERRLDPEWYFRPWERYATRLAAEYLIRANATPAQQKRGRLEHGTRRRNPIHGILCSRHYCFPRCVSAPEPEKDIPCGAAGVCLDSAIIACRSIVEPALRLVGV